MTTIIAGRFGQQDAVRDAIAALARAGAPDSQIASFYVNPPGQHDLYPVGGDRDESPGAEHSDAGSAAGIGVGGAIGGAVGTATAPVTGPLGAITGALVGGHVGSLVGSLSRTQEADEVPPVRHSGMLVAVTATSDEEERQAIATLRTAGAFDLERAEGHIENGEWVDFDPLSAPEFIEPERPA